MITPGVTEVVTCGSGASFIGSITLEIVFESFGLLSEGAF